MIRTHEAGTLRASHAGEQVVLAGWVARRRDHGGVVFIDLRDASGVVQVVWRGEEAVAHDAAGRVLRPGDRRRCGSARPGNENPELPTGEIEVVADEVEVLSEADPLPFPVEGSAEVSEDVRLKYRYLDIRREDTARALRVRSQAAYLLNDVMREHRFVNVETPYLTRSTPEGARDFLVPVRLRPGQLVRAAAVAAAVQAAAHGRRPGAVLPAGPVLPGRGLPQGPAAGVHPDRRRDVVRHPRRRHRRGRGHRDPALVGAGRLPGAHAAAPDDLRRRDGAVRLGQARPAVRLRAHRPDRVLRRDGVPGFPGAVRRARW